MNHKHPLLLFFVFLSITSSLSAQQSILWEISGNGLQAPSYLMGTLKFMGEREFFIPPQAVDKLTQVRFFAIEDQVDHHAQHELNKAVHFGEGESLRSVLKPADYEKLVRFFDSEFGISPSRFEKRYSKLIPLAVSISMTRLSLGEKVRYYDIELLKLARKQKLQTYSLEEIEREAAAIRSYPMEAQVAALLHTLDNFAQQKREFVQLVEEYVDGDLEKIFQYTVHPVENNPVFIEEFYYKRNAEWLPKLDKMVHDQPSFIAVGVAHLEGEKGLISLLREKGYTLTPIPVTR